MAKDVITRFKLETTQYDSKIKNAAKELSDVAKSAKSAGADFERFTKDSLEAARSLGNIATSSTNAKDRAKELVGAFNDVARSYNQLTEEQKKSDFGKAMAQSLTQLQQRIRETKEEMKGLESGGGLFGGGKLDGMLQVFGGNVMTKVAGMATGLVTEMGDAVKQGIELARQGEGIRIAFERLGRGDILDGLREATHGTVTDLELMKAAVKFNDFKLPVEELGTMLAFAQQKAKDTGQSVDYMVDSIVTGLGRKSLMILDNLGLSAAEIKERMKETGDMTKAVGAIIRDQMAAAGDYVETAADRAAQANVSLQNKMEELGRKFGPLEQASTQFWTSMKIGILDIVGGPLAQLLNGLTEAGRLQNMLNNLNGEGDNTKVGGQLKKLQAIKKAGGSSYMFNSTLSGMMEDYNRQIMALDAQIKNGGKPIGGGSGSSQDVRYLQRQMDALKIMRDELKKGAQGILNTKTQNTTTTTTTDTKKDIKEDKDEFTEVIGLIGNAQERVSDLQRRIKEAPDETTITALRDQLKEAQAELDRLNGKKVEMAQGLSGFNTQTMGAWLQGRQSDLSKTELGSVGYSEIMGNIADMQTIKSIIEKSMAAGIDAAQFNLEPLWEKVFDGENIPDDVWKNIVDTINEKLAELKLEPIKLDFKTGNIANIGKETEKSWRGAASAMSAASSALQGLEDPGAKIAGIVGQAIANIALGFSQATAASSGGGIFGWIAAIAGGLTTMLSTIAAIHSATGYAQGGIVDGRGGGFVGGMAYSGDNVGNVRLDSGELVLNHAQQNNLANALEGGNNNNVENRQPYVNGELIYLGLNNYLKRTGRGEIVVSKR